MVKAMALQGILLGFFTLGMADYLGTGSLLFIIFETYIFKALVLPWLIAWLIRKNGIKREKEPSLTNFGNVFVTLLLIVGSLLLGVIMGKHEPLLNSNLLGTAIGSILVGLFIIVSWKKLITHILGYLVLENGIFLLSLSIMVHQPLMVNLGVLLDIFVGVFLMGLFMNHIHSTFEDIDVDDLNELRDE
jgi:hydrogenase-4 component E